MKKSQLILNIIFGNRCASCGQPMNITCDDNVCRQCSHELAKKLVNGPITINDPNIVADKFLFYYNDEKIKEMVLQMKDHPSRKICGYFAQVAAKCISDDLSFPEFDIITHCPRKPSKKRNIGYDHSQYFAKLLAENLNKPYYNVILRREGGKEQKKIKHLALRAKNIKNKFYINANHNIKRKRVLIVDDIVTTASTAKECARVLKEAGARKVMALFILD